MKRTLIAALLAALLTGCAAGTAETPDSTAQPSPARSYTQIDQETAKQMMEKDDGHVIVDVRRQDEYDTGHISGAILIPNESIGSDCPPELPDLDQILLVYCRSGRRSKEAAQKLADMGYTNVYEFGGILTWDGEITTGSETEQGGNDVTRLSFHSFDGGGPYFTVLADDAGLLSWEETQDYGNENHAEIDGAAFDVTFTFTGLRPGSTKLTIEERSPIAGNFDHIYAVTVDEDLCVTLELLSSRDLDEVVVEP